MGATQKTMDALEALLQPSRVGVETSRA